MVTFILFCLLSETKLRVYISSLIPQALEPQIYKSISKHSYQIVF
jgi:hypothetical protein